ncbi:hypothetical protein ACQPXM_23695 [Kribbella sp. CA-253562]
MSQNAWNYPPRRLPARQIDDSPPYDTYTEQTPAYRDEVARHYGLIS